MKIMVLLVLLKIVASTNLTYGQYYWMENGKQHLVIKVEGTKSYRLGSTLI